MTMTEKRKHPRTDSLNLINYIHFDEDGNEGSQGMGRTLNVSPSGILLETHYSVSVNHVISLSIGLKDDMIDIKGRVKYSNATASGKFESGIEFYEMDQSSLAVLNKYIAAFNAENQSK